MKVLVIGGSGLIGSQVIANLTELGHEAVPASPSNFGVCGRRSRIPRPRHLPPPARH